MSGCARPIWPALLIAPGLALAVRAAEPSKPESAAGAGRSGIVELAKPDLSEAPLAAEAARLRSVLLCQGVRKIVYALRMPGKDGHYYNTIGFDARKNTPMYPVGGGRIEVYDVETGKATVLVEDKDGTFRDPCVHYDGKTVLYAYRRGGADHFHLYETSLDGAAPRQITDGPFDDFEPSYLPDDDIVFVSSRCNRHVACWYTPVAVVYRCKRDGSDLRRLSPNLEHDNTPWMLPDGRVLFTRWEYADRSEMLFHHLWTMNPDGTGAMTLFGNMHPSEVLIDAKPIPGSRRIVAIKSGYHGNRDHEGSVVLIDPAGGPDSVAPPRLPAIAHKARDPYALSEDLILAAVGRSLVVIERVSPEAAKTGGYRTTELYVAPPDNGYPAGVTLHEPRPAIVRTRERLVPPRTNPNQSTGTLVLSDVTFGRNMEGVKPGEIRKLLVLEPLPEPVSVNEWQDPVSLHGDGTYFLQRIWGTVPVEEDGSAHFRLPAGRPFMFVALNKDDLAVKRMHSFTSVMPGEITSCFGCHEHRTNAPPAKKYVQQLQALRRPSSELTPFPGVPDVISFPRDIQPILDKHCVTCHGADRRPAGDAPLTGARGEDAFSHSYQALLLRDQVSYSRTHGAGNGTFAGKSVRYKVTPDSPTLKRIDTYGNLPPYTVGSSCSPLMEKLRGKHHNVKLSEPEVTLVRLWIDSGVTYPGTYATPTGWRNRLGAKEIEAVRAKRCASCHAGKNLGGPVVTFLQYNLTEPAKSACLMAPLAKAAGGWGVCRGAGKSPASAEADAETGVFLNRQDPDYQTFLATLQRFARELADEEAAGIHPGFRRNEPYVRLMKQYGILPANLPDGARVDPFKTDKAYWASFSQVPHGQERAQ